jgi:DNA-binding response OmpR family regulator
VNPLTATKRDSRSQALLLRARGLHIVVAMSTRIALVVEDDPAARFLLTRILRAIGLSPIGFGSAEAAIAYIEMNGAPSFVSIDVCLPRMSGFELCEWLRANTRGVATAVVTARAGLTDETRALSLGAAYIEKPVRMRHYCAVVRALLGDDDDATERTLEVVETIDPQSVHFWAKQP